MTQHNHTTIVPGCYRCELGQDEAADAGPEHCECENRERDLYVWRGDPDWWSCTQCDDRVRLLTEGERRHHSIRATRPAKNENEAGSHG